MDVLLLLGPEKVSWPTCVGLVSIHADPKGIGFTSEDQDAQFEFCGAFVTVTGQKEGMPSSLGRDVARKG